MSCNSWSLSGLRSYLVVSFRGKGIVKWMIECRHIYTNKTPSSYRIYIEYNSSDLTHASIILHQDPMFQICRLFVEIFLTLCQKFAWVGTEYLPFNERLIRWLTMDLNYSAYQLNQQQPPNNHSRFGNGASNGGGAASLLMQQREQLHQGKRRLSLTPTNGYRSIHSFVPSCIDPSCLVLRCRRFCGI